ncbi:MAG: BON domain-containing protein [Pseudomonadota bacterium]
MEDQEVIVKQMHAALEHEAHIDMQQKPIDIHIGNGTIALGGELPTIADKKRAARAAARVTGGYGVVDRICVTPAEHMGDGAIRDAVARLLLRDADFNNCTIRVHNKGAVETLHECVGDWCSRIDIAVEDGIVTLTGEVISLTHKRLAGALAWWVPGTRDVVNELAVRPREDDNDDEVTDAVRWLFETDPHVHAENISVKTRNFVVTLDGVVGSEAERRRAENDAWCVFGVDDVVNRIEVRPAQMGL